MSKCFVRIGNNVGVCNNTGIGLHLREISPNMKVLLTDEWMMYSKDELNDCMWPLQYKVNLKKNNYSNAFNPKFTKHACTDYITQ